jgi:cathepsin F
MKSIVIAIAILSLACLSLANTDEELFRKFIHTHKRVYTPGEYQLRFKNFQTNLRRIDELNNMEGQQATFAVNKFSDLSKDEFASKYLLPKFDPSTLCIWPWHKIAQVPQEKIDAIPPTFDWTTKGAVTPVKNQADCGSCWTFSTTGNIEGQWALWSAKKALIGLSEQWIVDCSNACLVSEPDLCNGGCGGGLPWLAYESIINHKGLTTEASYPYTGEDGTCQTGNPISAVIANWTALPSDPTQIITFMYNQGPLSITLNADLLMSYSSGTITGTPSTCPASEMDHAVLLVGYGTNGTTPFWTVKNSWGTDWGMAGYFNIESDNGLCGINTCVTSTLLN